MAPLRSDFERTGAVASGQWLGAGVLRTVQESHRTVEYLHLNQVRRGLVRRAEEWRWSSGHEYAGVSGETGRPIARAKVNISEVHSVEHRALRYFLTDTEGRFEIANLAWGTYRVFAGKTEEGYPEIPGSFDVSGYDFPIVTLQPASPLATSEARAGRPRSEVN
jgi:hypothetical protein